MLEPDTVRAEGEKSRAELLDEIARLRARLAAPEETANARRRGEVDAFVALAASGETVYPLAAPELLLQLQLITDSLPVLVAYVDRERRYRFANRRYESWFGRPLAQILGAPIAEVLGEATYAEVHDQVDEALAGHQVAFERWVPHHGGGKRCIHATYVPHLHDGKVLGFVAFVADVTERRRADDALRLLAGAGQILSESLGGEETLDDAARLAVPALADWCVIDLATEDGGSQRIVSLHGDPARQGLMEELKRHPPSWDGNSPQAEVMRSGGAAFFPDSPAAALAFRPQVEDHSRILRQLEPRSAISVPLIARGRRLGVWSFVYSGSGRRYHQEDLRTGQELARRVAVALDNTRLYRQVEAANSAKDHFLATLSHELRTPLTPVLAMASRLQADRAVPAELQAGLDMIRRNVELEARLIDDLLDLTRIARGTLDLHCLPTDLRQVIRQAIEACGERELERRHLVLDLAEAGHVIWGDPSRLTQMFWNLLSNAIKFTPPGGAITVRSWREGSAAPAGQPAAEYLVVEVADSGVGIAEEELSRIFNAFDRGRTGRSVGGLGLGLAIGRSIVELHGGRLAAASRGRDQGATFTVRLPLYQAVSAGEPAAVEALRTAPPAPPALPARLAPEDATVQRAALHILLVEDHADTADAMAQLLADMGHRITVTGTVAASLAAAAAGGIDLVVSDLGLPDGDGYDLMRTLAGRFNLRGIALSGYGMDDDIARSHEAGFSLHVTKPVSLDTLRAAIRSVTVAGGAGDDH